MAREQPPQGNYQDTMMQAMDEEQMPMEQPAQMPPEGGAPPMEGGGGDEEVLRQQLQEFLQVLPKELQAMFSMESVQEALMTLEPDDFNEFFLTLLQQADLADPNAAPVASEVQSAGMEGAPDMATEPAEAPGQEPGYEDMMMEMA